MATKHKIIIATLILLCSIVFLGFVLPYTINICTNYRLHYAWIEFKGIFTFGVGKHMFLGQTPDNNYALHLVNYSWQGDYIVIETAKKYSYKPTEILLIEDEHLDVPIGPLQKDYDVVCSKDSRHIAAVRRGWFVDSYDYATNTRDSLDIVLYGKIKKPDMEKWKAYHNRISEIMGDDVISVFPNN